MPWLTYKDINSGILKKMDLKSQVMRLIYESNSLIIHFIFK
jgi:hypothetical protein